MSAFTKEDLKRFQAENLDDKFQRSLAKVSEWYMRWNYEVYVSFSGGKDSTVLADICAYWCKVIGKPLHLVFINTGLEYPEIQQFVKFFAQWLRDKYEIEVILDVLRPKMRFDEVIKTYGYPLISKEVAKKISEYRSKPDGYTNLVFNPESEKIKRYGKRYDMSKWIPLRDSNIPISHKCCDVMKKAPAHLFEKVTGKKPIIATLAEESALRQTEWIRSGCNAFDGKRPVSKPMSFWTGQDVLAYLDKYNVPIAAPYGDIVKDKAGKYMTTKCDRTGCIFCAFGCHNDSGESRFQRLKETHPRQYEYCIGGGEYDEKGAWRPNKAGLGMGHVFDELNSLYGEDFIRYKSRSEWLDELLGGDV